ALTSGFWRSAEFFGYTFPLSGFFLISGMGEASATEKPTQSSTQQTSAESSTKAPFVSPIDFPQLQKKSPEAIAWLSIDGTKIDYPVMHTEDNQYYVHNSAQGESSKYGAIFLDFRNKGDFSDFYNVIYGHNMRDGTMFGTLDDFKKKAFFDRVKTGELHLPDKSYELQFFSCAVTKATGAYYVNLAFFSPAEKKKHLEMLQKTAKYWRDIEIGEEDHLVLLSSCSYEFTDARTVLLAKLAELPR
ncbi:MAG: class B sortase, partial [Oscillospiraceae bacterium]|nr:class B sortase [Oscillospiraceae bacterium]